MRLPLAGASPLTVLSWLVVAVQLSLVALTGGGCAAGGEHSDSEPYTATVQGTIELVSIDGSADSETKFDDGSSGSERMAVFVSTDDGKLLELVIADSDASFLESGDLVSITGTIDAGVIRCGLDEVAILEREPRQVIAAARTTRKVAVILFNFTSDTTQPIAKEDALERIFTGPTSANAFLKAASYGQLEIAGAVSASGDVFGWYTIADVNDDCDTSTWRRLASQAATQAGADLAVYDHIMYVFRSAPKCSWAGLGAIGGVWSMVKAGYTAGKTPAHELGHNLGLSHSSSYSCDRSGTPVTLSSTCTVSAYGDPFDAMGGKYHQFNGYQKARLGWVSSTTQTISTDGEYTVDLAPLESTTAASQVLRVYRASHSDYYYVEYRQPAAFDAFDSTLPVVNGLSIRLAPDPGTRAAPLLLDMTPSTASFDDAPLPFGRTWADLQSQIAITAVSPSTTGALVRVTVGVGVVLAPADATPGTVAPTGPRDAR